MSTINFKIHTEFPFSTLKNSFHYTNLKENYKAET